MHDHPVSALASRADGGVGGARDPVLATAFRLVERGICSAPECAWRIIRTRRSTANAHREQAAGQGHCAGGKAHALGHGNRLVDARSFEEHAELISTDACQQILAANGRREHARRGTQRMVPRLMAMRVVHVLEVVEVDGEHGVAAGVRAIEAIVERTAVLQSGQWIHRRQLLQARRRGTRGMLRTPAREQLSEPRGEIDERRADVVVEVAQGCAAEHQHTDDVEVGRRRYCDLETAGCSRRCEPALPRAESTHGDVPL